MAPVEPGSSNGRAALRDRPSRDGYSHLDRRWLERLTEVLAPVVRKGEISLWDDSSIATGAAWEEEIDQALSEANVAVLLVTPAFLASDFINSVELPRLVAAAEDGRMTLVWIAVSSSLFGSTPLSRFQAANDPNRPLDQLSRAQANTTLVDVAEKIVSGSTLTSVAGVLRTVDEVKNELAEVSGRAPSARPYSVVAHLTPTEERALDAAAAGMCSDLQRIFSFLAMIGKYLDDHYTEVSVICQDFPAAGS
jgi:hypothetical protein